MSAFKQNTRKLGIRAGLLAGASAAVLAVAGLSAGSAMAATPTCPNTTQTIKGEGSSLQATAQTNWIAGYKAACSGGPTVTYTSTSSLEAQKQWGATGGTINREHAFIGSDEPLESTQIEKIKTAAGTGSHLQIVPVAQAAIAIIVNTPGEGSTCKLPEINYGQLEEIYAGALTSWSSLTHKEGTCSGTISHIVREDASGTTYQFKTFLSKVNTAERGCGTNKHGWSTWRTFADNLLWPGGTGTSEGSGCPTPAIKSGGSGGGALITKVASTDGSFGYVDAATVENSAAFKEGKVTIVKVQNSATTFASPLTKNAKSEEKEANCVGTVYTVPTGATTGEAEDVNWTGAGGPSTNPGGSRYPICTLTYDVAFHNYHEAGFGTEFGEAVKDYLLRLVLESSTTLEGDYYAPLPANVLTASKYAAERISH
jgi:ABC-type phosphate transport system substrate-binding protein